MRVKSEIIVSN